MPERTGLAALLRLGLTVLDIGCGTGAITRDIAAAVAPHGQVVGVDVHAGLIAEARRVHGAVPGLTFEVCDVYTLPFRATDAEGAGGAHTLAGVVEVGPTVGWPPRGPRVRRPAAAHQAPTLINPVLNEGREDTCSHVTRLLRLPNCLAPASGSGGRHGSPQAPVQSFGIPISHWRYALTYLDYAPGA